MKNLSIQIENQAIIKIDEKLFEIGEEISYKIQNLANSIYDNMYPSIISDIRLNKFDDFKHYTETKLTEMMKNFETQAHNIYCNSYESSTVEIIGQQLIFKTAFNMNYEYMLQKYSNFKTNIENEDMNFKVELEKEKKRFQEARHKLKTENEKEINKLKQIIEEKMLQYKKYIKEFENIVTQEMTNYQTKQLNYNMETMEMRQNIQKEHQNQMLDYLIFLSEVHSKGYQLLSDQMLASTNLIMETNEYQHQITRMINSYETQTAKRDIIQFTNQRANDIQKLLIQESNSIKMLVHDEANRINQNIINESNLIHEHISKVNTIINNHIDNATNAINQHISVTANGINQHISTVANGLSQQIATVGSEIHQHISQAENNINANINTQSNYILKEIRVNRVNFNHRFDDAQKYNSMRFNQIQQANRFY